MRTRSIDIEPLSLALSALGSGQAWLVGGRIRDRLLDRPCLDTDLAVADGAIELARAIARASSGTAVVLDAARDVARVVWPGSPTRSLDIARLTSESIDADLRLRDFTVNAMALPLDAAGIDRLADGGPVLRERLLDPRGGLADLDQGILRLTAARALDDDPLRMLRALRLAAELRFEIDPESAVAIRSRAALASRPAGERQRGELLRLLAADRGAHDIARLDHLGLLEPVLPELAATRGVQQSLPHDRDVYQHCLASLAAVELLQALLARPSTDGDDPPCLRAMSAGGAIEIEPAWQGVIERNRASLLGHASAPGEIDRRLWWRMAALIHDIGKTETQRWDPGRGRFRFLGHDTKGAELIPGMGRRLRFSAQEARFLEGLLRHHLRPLHLAAAGGASARGIHHLFRDAGSIGVDVAFLALADNASKGGVRPDFAGHLAQVTGALFDAWFEHPELTVRPPMPLDGRELMQALALSPGPQVGQLLAQIAEAIAVGELPPGDREAAIALARHQLERR